MDTADQSSSRPQRRCVLVCQYQTCTRNGSAAVLAAFQAAAAPNVIVSPSDCQGQCNVGPNVQIIPDRTYYCRVGVDDVPLIVEQHLQQNQPVETLLHPRFHPRFG